MNPTPTISFSFNQTQDHWHGLVNGLDQLDKETYEALVSSEEMLQFLTQRKEEKTAHLQHLTAQIQAIKNNISQKRAESWKHQEKVMLCDEELQRVQKKKSDISLHVNKLQESLQSQKPHASIFMGMVFFLAGWVFILGDLIISHEIVAYALQIRGKFESWAFAVGLALLSLLLKPAYDHWIEKPSVPGTKGSSFKMFHVLIALLTLSTLGVLGWFRFEAYQVEQRKVEINRQLRQLQIQLESPELGDASASIQQKMDQLGQLTMSLVDSPKALWAFVLSGILFALAGAICLGMSVPVLQYHKNRWFLIQPQLKKLNQTWEQLDLREAELSQTRISHQWAYQACLDTHLEEGLEMERSIVQQEIEALFEKITRARENIRISQYSEGYQRGILARKTISPAELNQWRESWGIPSSNASANHSFSSYLHS